MKTIFLMILASISINVSAQLNHFVADTPIEASKINENFNYGKIKWQEKVFTFGNSLSTLNFSNLEIGKTYRITLNIVKGTGSAAVNWYVENETGKTLIGNYFNGIQGRYGSTTKVFTAKTPNLILYGSGGADTGSSLLLEELPLHEEASLW